MLVNDKEAVARLHSPSNLMNKLSSLKPHATRKEAMSLFIPAAQKKEQHSISSNGTGTDETSPQPVGLDDILDNNDSKIKLALAHDNALKLLNNSVNLLADKLDEVAAAKLPGVIAAAGKVVESIRKERSEQSRNEHGKDVHYHFYTPELRKVNDYQIIDVAS